MRLRGLAVDATKAKWPRSSRAEEAASKSAAGFIKRRGLDACERGRPRGTMDDPVHARTHPPTHTHTTHVYLSSVTAQSDLDEDDDPGAGGDSQRDRDTARWSERKAARMAPWKLRAIIRCIIYVYACAYTRACIVDRTMSGSFRIRL